MNWGNVGAWAGAGLALFSSIGYGFAGDIRRTLYFFFAFAITVTIAWPQ